MIYAVDARPIEATLPELYRKLEDGTIEAQEPDGRELVASMHRARVGNDGRVRWTEMCFCSPPLAHERRTVLDHHFEDMSIEPVRDHREFAGQRFVNYLEQVAGG